MSCANYGGGHCAQRRVDARRGLYFDAAIFHRLPHGRRPLIGDSGIDRKARVQRHHAFTGVGREPIRVSAQPSAKEAAERGSHGRKILGVHRAQIAVGGAAVHQIIEAVDDAVNAVTPADRKKGRLSGTQLPRPRSASWRLSPPSTSMNMSIRVATICGKYWLIK